MGGCGLGVIEREEHNQKKECVHKSSDFLIEPGGPIPPRCPANPIVSGLESGAILCSAAKHVNRVFYDAGTTPIDYACSDGEHRGNVRP